MKIELTYKDCCIIKHALKRSIDMRQNNIENKINTGRDEFKELQDDIICFNTIKLAIDELKK